MKMMCPTCSIYPSLIPLPFILSLSLSLSLSYAPMRTHNILHFKSNLVGTAEFINTVHYFWFLSSPPSFLFF